MTSRLTTSATWVAVVLVVVLSRLAHLRLVWVEEAYGLAAARELLRGKQLYSQIWFDKPPIYAWFYVLCGGLDGLPLRMLDSALILLICVCFWWLARSWWGPHEGLLAAVLGASALTFWIPSAVMAVAPDLLMLAPAALAVLAASRGYLAASGAAAGVAVLCNSKALVFLGAALLWSGSGWWRVLGGFVAVQVAGLLAVPVGDYWREVWVWGLAYSRDTFVARPMLEGLRRSAGWVGFHGAIVAGVLVALRREWSWRWAGWILLSAAAVIGGWRFFPRYYFALLPVGCVLGARGLMLLTPRWRVAVLAVGLGIPVVRFGPRYLDVARNGGLGWSDTALMEDSRQVAAILKSAAAGPDSDLLVWGYRPDVFVFSGLAAGTLYLDSQPLTGVLADRHLVSSKVTLAGVGAVNRKALVAGRRWPEFIVDGLGPVNAALAIEGYEDLRPMMAAYDRLGSTGASVVYRLRSALPGPAGRSLFEKR